MAPNATLDRLYGPYEAWVFGDDGQSYAGPDGKLAGAAFVAALAELPLQHPLLKQSTPFEIDSERIAHQPTIWRAGVRGGAACFLPLILELKGSAERSFDLSYLGEFIFDLANRSAPWVWMSLPKPHYGFRLNAPLPPETFDRSFSEAPREPTFQPNARLKAELARDVGEESPLVIMAVIDDGLAYAHPTLRDRDNAPRMEFCWLQSAEIPSRQEERTVLFGREHTRHTLADLLHQKGDDEDAFYRAAGSIGRKGMAQPLAGLSAHGAHVLHLATGRWGEDVGPSDLERIRVIGVELPSPLVMDTVGFGKDAYILSAFHYIFDRADRIAEAYGTRPLPLVINFSFGFTGGPHDGTDRLEEAIGRLIRARRYEKQAPTELVMPAGNQFLGALNAEISAAKLASNGRFSIPWRIQPNDQTANYLEIWYPPEAEGEVSAMPGPPVVTSPAGRSWNAGTPAEVMQGPAQRLWPLTIDGRVVGQVSIDKFRDSRWRVMVIVAPTETAEATRAGAPAGLWKIEVDTRRLREDSDAVISCRIQRDHSISHPLHHGRQSYFDHPQDPVFAPNGRWQQDDANAVLTRRFGSLNGLATREEVIVVAGVVAQSAAGPDLPALYSAAGRLDATPGGAAVSCAAVSDQSPTLPGVLAAGTRSGAAWRLSGTSAAAPQVARALALRLLQGERKSALKNSDSPVQQGIAAQIDLKPRPEHRSGQRSSGPDPLSARIGAGVLNTRTPDG